MKIETVEISSLVFDPHNARKHDEKNIKAIKGSLKNFEQQKPIVVGEGNTVLAGNGTLQSAIALGWTHIDIVRSKLVGLKAKAFATADNRTSELASWDQAMLGNTLQELREHDFDLDELGFDISSLDGPVPPTDNAGDDDDTVSEPIEKPLTLLISCKDEDEQQMLFLELRDRGFKVKA